jgi:hypothetical protein
MPNPWVALQSLRDGLREDQQEHLDTIDWLLNLDRYRGQGRTHLLAIGFMGQAIRANGAWIRPWDHFMNEGRGNYNVIQTIQTLASAFSAGSSVFEFSADSFGGRFRYNGPMFPEPLEAPTTEGAPPVSKSQPPPTKSGGRSMDLD